jgi:hypothetical protein
VESRRAPRQPARRIGWCHIAGDAADEQRDCRVVDISELGLGIVLGPLESSDLVGRLVAVETPVLGMATNIRLEGQVKNAAVETDGSVRLGIEFLGLTDLEQSVVKALGVPSALS